MRTGDLAEPVNMDDLAARSRARNASTMRAGSDVLMLLSAPLNVRILRGLEQQGPKELTELRRMAGLPPHSTLRVYLKALTDLGVVDSRRRSEFAASVDYGLTPAGQTLLDVANVVQRWLDACPTGSIPLGSAEAQNTIKALVKGWSTNIIWALAVKPLSLTELNRLIPRVSYPALERRLSALRMAQLLEGRRTSGRSKPYAVTDWLRRAVAPITSAIGWERTHISSSTSGPGRLDIEAVFLLAIPLMKLEDGVSGKCRLAVEVHDGASPVFAGVLVCVEDGVVTSCVTNLEGQAEAWASGKPMDWLRQLNSPSVRTLELGGDARLASAVAEALRRTGTEPD
jgi:DNA-binding HxlR family transcriptional regulator